MHLETLVIIEMIQLIIDTIGFLTFISYKILTLWILANRYKYTYPALWGISAGAYHDSLILVLLATNHRGYY